MTIQKTPKRGTRKTERRGEISHVEYEAPRIGNRSDALDMLKDIENVANWLGLPFVESSAQLIREAMERGLL
jgi:hypothetical protein